MANVNEVKNKLATTPPQQGLQELIEKSVIEIGKALPEHMRPERVVRIALTCIRQNPDLTKCTPASFLGALFTAAQLGIEPIAGQGYLLPFNNSRKINGSWVQMKECQFLLGYKGLISLFYRHNAALSIDAQEVYAGDEFEYQYGTDSFLRHRPASVRGKVVGYYAVAKLRGNVSIFKYMTAEECLEHGKKHSKTYKDGKFFDNSPWAKEFDAMAKKTVLIQLAKLLPLSMELQRAISTDETSRNYRSEIKEVIDIPDTTNWEAPEITQEEPLPAGIEELLPGSEPEPEAMPQSELPPPENLSNPINEKQMKLLFAKCHTAKKPIEDFKAHLKNTYGIEHTKDIQKEWMDDIIRWIDE